MSTESTRQNRRASLRYFVAADQSRAPSASPTGDKRTFAQVSTVSLASSMLSETFDVDESTLLPLESPITPPCDTSPPTCKNVAPRVDHFVQSLDDLSHSKIKVRKRRPAVADITPSKSAVRGTARSRPPPSLTRLKNSTSYPETTVIPNDSHLSPGTNVSRHQRASSAPTRLSRHEEPLDVDRLPELPGKYESQNSDPEVEIKREAESIPPSIILLRDEVDNEDGQSHVEEDDHRMDDGSSRSSDAGTSVQRDFVAGDSVDPQLPLFRPYTCVKGQPMKRRVIDKCSNNVNICKLIQKGEKRGKLGWVYIAELKGCGPEKLKIGMTMRAPMTRIEELQDVGLELEEIPDKYKNPFYHFWFLEKVVHLELSNQRLKLMRQKSGGKVQFRTEWFDIDRERALAVIEKWRNWLRIQKPFDSDGVLTPYWQWRVESAKGCIADVDWELWTQPSIWHYPIFLVNSHFARTRKDVHFFWTSAVVTLLSFLGHGGKGALWAVVFLLLL